MTVKELRQKLFEIQDQEKEVKIGGAWLLRPEWTDMSDDHLDASGQVFERTDMVIITRLI